MTRRCWSFRLILCSVVVVASGACGGDGKNGEGAKPAAADGAVSGEPAVTIVNFQFQPKSLTVRAGTAVKWTNEDTAVHSIKDTSALNTPVSADMGKGETFSITYGQPGSYSYICGIHQYMTGTVQVVA
ncbi:MAG: cupredoxin domain-containing protein [Actinomycetota bacterium]|jgi:plastocyanin